MSNKKYCLYFSFIRGFCQFLVRDNFYLLNFEKDDIIFLENIYARDLIYRFASWRTFKLVFFIIKLSLNVRP